MESIEKVIITLVAAIIGLAWPYVAVAVIFIVWGILMIPVLFGMLVYEIIKIKKNRKKLKKSELYTQK